MPVRARLGCGLLRGPGRRQAEVDRIRWLEGRITAPRVLTVGEDGNWFTTRAIRATSAVAPEWLTRPVDAVRALGSGLRLIHESLPHDRCPFDWSVESRTQAAVLRGDIDEFDAARLVASKPTTDRLVVAHGDACAPNLLISAGGSYAGAVDLGALGRADRWADIAVALRSLVWNYGEGFEPLFLEAYGVTVDEDRLHYYRELAAAT